VCLKEEDDKMCFLETCGWCYEELGRKKKKMEKK
jgi:hypothetical protein